MHNTIIIYNTILYCNVVFKVSGSGEESSTHQLKGQHRLVPARQVGVHGHDDTVGDDSQDDQPLEGGPADEPHEQPPEGGRWQLERLHKQQGYLTAMRKQMRGNANCIGRRGSHTHYTFRAGHLRYF